MPRDGLYGDERVDRAPLPIAVEPVAFAKQTFPRRIDPALAAAIDRAFTPDRKAIVVVRDGRIVGQRYAPGYGPTRRRRAGRWPSRQPTP